jgi:hypothetical protein
MALEVALAAEVVAGRLVSSQQLELQTLAREEAGRRTQLAHQTQGLVLVAQEL